VAYGDRTNPVTDDFSTDPFAARWANGPNSLSPLTWASNDYVVGTSVGDDGARRDNEGAWPNDQYCRLTLQNTTNSGWVGACVRMQTAVDANECYVYFAIENGNFTRGIWEISTSFGFTELATSTSFSSPTAGEFFVCEAEGTTIRGGSNESGSDTQELSTTDATVGSGRPGIHVFTTSQQIDAWEGGEISAVIIEQEGFRFGLDDGSESAHGWAANQDTNLGTAANLSRLIRFLLNATNDPAAIAYTLRFQKNGAGGYVAVPVGPTITTSPPTAPSPTVTTVGTAVDPWTINRRVASTGDMVVFVIAWDDSTTVATVTAPAGVNGETAQNIAGPVASASTEMRMQAWYYIATGTWGAGTLSFDPSAAETCRAVSFVIPAGQFNASDPIGFANTRASAGTAETNVNSPTGTAESNDGDGRLYIGFGSDVDALTVPGSNWNTINNATGGGVGLAVGSRNTLVTNSESIAALTATIAGDSWASLCFVVKPNVVNNEVYVNTSSNIAAGGEATTARLTAPSGKSTSDFVTGRRWDDENGTDAIDITTSDYTEVEWLVHIASSAQNNDYFDFRVYSGGSALPVYTVTPRWTITSLVELIVADLQHGHTLDTVGLTQTNTLSIAELAQAHALDSVVLAMLLTIAELSHSHALDSLVLTQANTLAISELLHAHSLDSIVLTQANVLAIAELMHAHSIDSVNLVQLYSLVMAGLQHEHSLDSLVLTQANVLALAELMHAHSIDSINLLQANVLAMFDLLHAHSIDAVVLVQANILALTDLQHGHSIDSVVLTQANVLSMADLMHAHSLESIVLFTSDFLEMEDAVHPHTLDGVVLTQANVLSMTELMHAHSLDSIVLTQANILALTDLQHAHTLDVPALLQANVLAIADLMHAHLLDNIVVIAGDTVLPEDLSHAHMLDSILLTQANVLAMADLLHQHSLESPTLTQANILALAELLHPHMLDQPALSQHIALTISELLHAHRLDGPELGLLGILIGDIITVARRELVMVVPVTRRSDNVFVVDSVPTTFRSLQ